MQQPQPNINQQQQGLQERANKDQIPFFYKIIATTIIGVTILGIVQPETRRALANIYSDIFYKGQIWRLFTNEFVTIGSIDCMFAVIFLYFSIGTYEKRVGSATFIVDFILISLLISIVIVIVELFASFVVGQSQQPIIYNKNGAFLGLWFFYKSRACYLEPDHDVRFFCVIIKQRNVPQFMFLLLLVLNLFQLKLIVSVAYLLVISQNYCFKNRFFTFNFTLYFKIQKFLGKLSKRDDFYGVEQCKQYSYSFINNIEQYQKSIIQARQLFQRVGNINVRFQSVQNMRDQIQQPNFNNLTQQHIHIKEHQQHNILSQTTQQQNDHNHSRMKINIEREEILPNI